jgi:hypothetical protein
VIQFPATLPLLFAEATDAAVETPIERLDPPTRAMVLMALIGLVLVGLALILLTMIGARWVRRLGRERRAPRDWPKLRDRDPGRSAEIDPVDGNYSKETLAGRPNQDDTVNE